MSFRAQYLADVRNRFSPSARHCAVGRTWVNITKHPVKRYSVAEKIALNYRIDSSAITRVLQVRT